MARQHFDGRVEHICVGSEVHVRAVLAQARVVVCCEHRGAVGADQLQRCVVDMSLGCADHRVKVVGDAGSEIGFKDLAFGSADRAVDGAHISRNLDLVAALDDGASVAAVAIVAQEDVTVEVAAAVIGVAAVVTVAVAEPVVRVWVAVAIFDKQSIVVDAIKKIDHLMDGEIAVAIVVEKRVEGLELLDVELLQPAMLLIDGPLD
jgi:hypothetical protein